MMNLGTTVPGDLSEIKIKEDRSPRFLFKRDSHFFASCKTSKLALMKWLKTSNFEVVVFSKDTAGKQIFITKYDSLTKEIIDCRTNYLVQLSQKVADSPMLYVMPVDSHNVRLKFDFDWN